jgi:hypothetical protein
MRMIKVRKLRAKEQAAPKAVAAMPDREIATSNSPEFRDWKRRPVRSGLSKPWICLHGRR